MVNSTGRFILSFTSHFVLVFLSPFTIAITLYREKRAGLCAFHAFVCFVRVDLCLFPLRLGARDGLRLV